VNKPKTAKPVSRSATSPGSGRFKPGYGHCFSPVRSAAGPARLLNKAPQEGKT
jgi:hypothetical protein